MGRAPTAKRKRKRRRRRPRSGNKGAAAALPDCFSNLPAALAPPPTPAREPRRPCTASLTCSRRAPARPLRAQLLPVRRIPSRAASRLWRLGATEADEAAQTATQNRHTYEKPVKIYN